jgi:hypothetical protein
MAYFAVIDNTNTVINKIIADSLEIAEQVTGLTCVEYTPGNNEPKMYCLYINGETVYDDSYVNLTDSTGVN